MIEAWVTVRATARLGEDGSVTPISTREWLKAWDRLRELGGPPELFPDAEKPKPTSTEPSFAFFCFGSRDP